MSKQEIGKLETKIACVMHRLTFVRDCIKHHHPVPMKELQRAIDDMAEIKIDLRLGEEQPTQEPEGDGWVTIFPMQEQLEVPSENPERLRKSFDVV